MEESTNIEDNINIYSANFEYEGNNEHILSLYKLNEKVENNDIIAKKINKKIYFHPLFLNYNYCLFCLEKSKTKYSFKNLYDRHKIIGIKKIIHFLKKENIKLKYPDNKNEKLAKRRFIHSCEHSGKEIINSNKYSGSDTEVYIEDKEKLNIIKKISKISNYGQNSSSNNRAMNNSFISENSFSNQKHLKINLNKIKLKPIKHTKSTHEQNKLVIKKNISNQSFTDKKENSIFKRRNRNLKTTKKISKPISFFGIEINPFNNGYKNETKDFFLEQSEEDKINSFQYFEKNEKCGICLGVIKDKFTLFCGDFFCRDCIVNLLEESINDLTIFNKLICPMCKEPINENTIKFLLKGKNLKKYRKQKMKIEGLKNPNNIPCPFPDCEGFANKEKEINNTYTCQNGHLFCKLCSYPIDLKKEKNKHICNVEERIPKTYHYLHNNKNIRKCPNCNCWVEREPKGCNYFKCANIWCKYEFCWICGSKYEPSHYKNPLSPCFRLSESDYQGKLIESNKIRRIRCILILLLIILILFPIICIFFSFFAIISYAMYFHFDGKKLRSVRLHTKVSDKIFYAFYFSFIILLSLGLIPFGYMCLALLIIAIPVIIIIKKVRKNKNDF